MRQRASFNLVCFLVVFSHGGVVITCAFTAFVPKLVVAFVLLLGPYVYMNTFIHVLRGRIVQYLQMFTCHPKLVECVTSVRGNFA